MERPLHVAILSQHTEFVSYLVNMMCTDDLKLKNKDGNTAFCLAAIAGYVGMAKIMVEKHPILQIICGKENMTPLSLAAFHGKHEMVMFLYDLSDRMKDESWTEHRNEVLLKYVAIRILEDNEKLPQDNHVWDVLQVLAQNTGAFTNRAFTGLVTRPKESKGVQLLRLLLKRVAEKPTDTIDKILRGPMIMKDETETYPSHILFIAAKMNKQFLVELIRELPDLIWQRNDDGQTIFHIAVAHRHHDVYKLLKNIGSMKDFIISIADNKGNNILHMVGNLPEKIAYDDSETTPYEVLCEYFWYKEVESTLPPRYRQMKNKAGHTPEEKFTINGPQGCDFQSMHGKEKANNDPEIQVNNKEKSVEDNIRAIPNEYVLGIRDLIIETVNPLIDLMKNYPSRSALHSNKRLSQSKSETVHSKRETKNVSEKKESERKKESSYHSSTVENELRNKTKKLKI
ncbi:uncharacterized protein LOC143577047 [Bidens hawaiensis]|uniref:uncharacterized protein LOC143577047 n=1 Tax=Bidens hawaiensis TaxID=980011 RepID=UPI00404A2A58